VFQHFHGYVFPWFPVSLARVFVICAEDLTRFLAKAM